MAKKKINIKSVTSDVPSGDVNITYKNVRIAGLSESTTAVLETEDTICEGDIDVEYTKPSTAITMKVNKKIEGGGASTLITTYSGNGNTLIDVDISIPSSYTVTACYATNILGDNLKNIPYIFDGNTTVTIPTINLSEIAPTASSVVVLCSLK